MVLKFLDLLLQFIKTNLVIFNDQIDLQLLDAETHCYKLGGTPNEAILLNPADSGLERHHVCLIVYESNQYQVTPLMSMVTYPKA